jgi:hypothetical protein
VALEGLVGQPVKVVWAARRRGRHVAGVLTLTALSRDGSKLYLKGREMQTLRST